MVSAGLSRPLGFGFRAWRPGDRPSPAHPRTLQVLPRASGGHWCPHSRAGTPAPGHKPSVGIAGQFPKHPWTERDLLDFPRLHLSKYVSLVTCVRLDAQRAGGKEIDCEDVRQC